jgi:predicted ArsR family transcriptional regulator
MGKTFRGTGFQSTDTSLSAALQAEHRAPNLREDVLHYLRMIERPASTNDIAEALGRPYPSIQPRLSELREQGKVRDSGQRGLTEYGRPCILWQAIKRSA